MQDWRTQDQISTPDLDHELLQTHPQNLVAALVGGEVGIWDYWPSFKHMGAVRADYLSTDTPISTS